MTGKHFDLASDIDHCSMCATCTYVCPVFRRTRMEGHTARGHIHLIDAFLLRPGGVVNTDGTIAVSDAPKITREFEDMLDCCLRCYKCLDVCPSGISTVNIFEDGRAEIARRRLLPKLSDTITSLILASRTRLHVAARLGWLGQMLLSLFWRPKHVSRGDESPGSARRGASEKGRSAFKSPADDAFWFAGDIAVPKIAPRFFLGSDFARARAPRRKKALVAATNAGAVSGASLEEMRDSIVRRERRQRVGYLVDCMTDTLYPAVAEATVKVLEAAGCEVVIPEDAGCCGAPLLGTGDSAGFARMAKATRDLFMSLDCDYIITSNPTCAKTMKFVYPERLGDGFNEFSERVRMDFEVMTLNLDKLRIEKLDELIGWHDPCHQRYAYGVYREPRELLKMCAHYNERAGENECCGFGGTFCVDFPKMAQGMAADKAAFLAGNPEKEIATTCPACLYYLNQFSANEGADRRAVHLSEIVLRSISERA